MALEARNHLHDYRTGATRPQLFQCDRDRASEHWVLKLGGLANAELAADWIGCSLATRLGVRCPTADIAFVSDDAIATIPDEEVRRWARPGAAFATREMTLLPIVTEDQISRFSTPTQLARILVLDISLEVLDRKKPEGDWNLQIEDDSTLVVLDYGKSLTECTFQTVGVANLTLAEYPSAIRFGASRIGIEECCNEVANISEEELSDMVTSVPEVWLSASQRTCILEFLVRRRRELRALCGLETWGGAS